MAYPVHLGGGTPVLSLVLSGDGLVPGPVWVVRPGLVWGYPQAGPDKTGPGPGQDYKVPPVPGCGRTTPVKT